MNQNRAIFIWAKVSYFIPIDTTHRKILLPNGTVLVYDGILHSTQDQLIDLKSAGFSIAVLPETDLVTVATQLGAILAIELGYCPKHPEEHGAFCSKCGKPISSPVILPPKPPFPFTTKNSYAGVMGNGPCPNCKKTLDHNAHANSCPNCGQALQWLCR